jgi:hypothetical protein
MRELNVQENTIEIQDGISGDVHAIRCRKPTMHEMAAYQAGLFERKGKKMINRIYQTRVEFGKKIITGFVKGTLGVDGQAFASDPADPQYREDWLDILCTMAPEIVAAVAMQAYEGTGLARLDLDMVPESEDDTPLDAGAISTSTQR